MVCSRARLRVISMIVTASALLTIASRSHPAHAQTPDAPTASATCASSSGAASASVVAGRPYLALAYQALINDRRLLARLGPQSCSVALSQVAERHSAYMVSIHSWSDGDPEGGILGRVRAAGVGATYAGQNVVTAHGATVASAVRQGEDFFAQEAAGGGPHWDNITNPNHHYVGMGLALLGEPGDYTIYLTQVFASADVAGAAAAPVPDTQMAPAAASATSLKIGATVHPTVDPLRLRTQPRGAVIGTLHAQDQLQILDLRGDWAQVKQASTGIVGWAFAAYLTSA